MEAKKFIEKFNKMCKFYLSETETGCWQCPLYDLNLDRDKGCEELVFEDTDDVIKIVSEWKGGKNRGCGRIPKSVG